MSEQGGTQVSTLQRPANDNKEAWKAYWKALGQSWRIEPEIDLERQKYLAERRSITPDIEQGIYPFKDIDPKLSRADVEWLLATHKNGRDSQIMYAKRQNEFYGLDLRGANLNNVDLTHLPLVGMQGGLTWDEWIPATQEHRDMAAVYMEGTDLRWAHLEHAILQEAHLENADFEGAYLEEAEFRGAHLNKAKFHFAHLKKSYFRGAYLKWTDLTDADLMGARIINIVLSDESGVGPFIADARWDDVNLAVVNWSQIKELGDEHIARQRKRDGKTKDKAARLAEFEQAVRANRQLAIALQAQGLNEDAARFTYRAQLLQCQVFGHQRKYVKYLGSLFLDLLSGYGYRPLRCFIAYLFVILTFATIYFIIGHTVGPVLSPLGSVVFSMTSFHGRGFFPGGIILDDPLTVVAALEAFIGLLIEVTFIATLTQRLFGK